MCYCETADPAGGLSVPGSPLGSVTKGVKMSEPISAHYISVGLTSEGYSLEVTYRCVGQPHVWQYLSLRGLLWSELSELLEPVSGVLRPGSQPPGIQGQLPLLW